MRLLSSLVFGLFFIASAHGQKTVLIEKWTNAFCGQCPDGTVLLEDLEERYPNLIWVLHHKPVTWIDNELNNEDSAEIYYDLDKPPTPTAMVDRALDYQSRLIIGMRNWEEQLLVQEQQQAYAQVSIKDLTYDNATRTFDFSVETVFDAIPNANRFSFSAMMIEDKVESMEQHSYFNDTAGHPLEGRGNVIWDYKHRNVVRAILDGPWGTNQTIPLEPTLGESYVMRYSYTVPESYKVENMKIVASLSQHNDNDVKDRAIMNSTQVILNETGLNLSHTDELESRPQFTFSPNPASTNVNLSFSVIPQKVQLMNTKGELLNEVSPNSSEYKLDIAAYPSGLYFLKLDYENKSIVEKLVID